MKSDFLASGDAICLATQEAIVDSRVLGIVIGALLFGAVVGCAVLTSVNVVYSGWFGPTNFDECVIEDMKGQVERMDQHNMLTPLACDLTNSNDVTLVINHVTKVSDHLDVVINLAGILVIGPLVERSVDLLRKTLEVNLIATYLINQLTFPLIRKGKGRYINVSSEYGTLDALPFHGFYTLSKHALEVYNDGLRRELKSYDIPVIVIRPGSFNTPMQQKVMNQFDQVLEQTSLYQKPLTKMKHIMVEELKKAKDPVLVAKKILTAASVKRPHLVYRIKTSLRMRLLSSLPPRIQDAIFAHFFK